MLTLFCKESNKKYMETKVISFVKNGKRIEEKVVVTKPLSLYGWAVVESAAEVFYEHNRLPTAFQVQKFARNCSVTGESEFVLEPNMLLHFSTGLTNVKTVTDILKNGLKSYEVNISKYKKSFKAKDESNYVVDTWQMNSRMKYSDFAQNPPRYGNGFDLDRCDLAKIYTPAYSVTDFRPDYIKSIKNGLIFNFEGLTDEQKKDVESMALQNIGFIIDSRKMPEELMSLDIYANHTKQREFCGDSFLKNARLKGCYTVLKSTNEMTYPVGRYGVASFVYGIPGEFIMGVIAPYGLLYSDEMCKALFNSGMGSRIILSPTGNLLYKPNYKLTNEQNFEEFVRNKNEFLAGIDKDYRLFLLTKDVMHLEISPWHNTDINEQYSYRSVFRTLAMQTSVVSEEEGVTSFQFEFSDDVFVKPSTPNATVSIDGAMGSVQLNEYELNPKEDFFSGEEDNDCM